MVRSFPAKWPDGFDPDSNSIVGESFFVIESDNDGNIPSLHQHKTGQLCITLSGHAGIVGTEGYWSVPTACAAWCPPGTLHCGFLSPGACTIFVHFGPEFCKRLPETPQRLLLNPMTVAMTKHVTEAGIKWGESRQASLIWEVIVGELASAPALPKAFAPLPLSQKYRQLTEKAIDDSEFRSLSAKEVAARLNLSERTLRRRLLAETGLNFSAWIRQIKLLAGLKELRAGKSVEEASFSAGFQNPSSFIVAFKAVFGVTPSHFRIKI